MQNQDLRKQIWGAEKMSLTVVHFNTWGGCLAQKQRPDYYDYIRTQADTADVLHLSEVHSCTDPAMPEFITPEDAGHRVGGLHVRQLQTLKKVLGTTHDVHFEPQMNGLHDLDMSHPTVQYGNVTCVKKGLPQNIQSGMIYREFNDTNTQSEGGLPAGKSAQSVIIRKNGAWYQSVSTHGHWDYRSKIDTPERWVQFSNMMSFAHAHKMSKGFVVPEDVKLIVGGDFNLTSRCKVLEGIRKSMQFGEDGGIILNHKYHEVLKSLSTRTKWYPRDKSYREANFVIVGQNVHELDFEIDYEAPSDHCRIRTVLQ